MIVLKLILFTLFISVSKCRIPDKVYCANKDCNGPISKVKTLLSYNSGDPDLISFRGNSEAIVYMKSAGTNPDLWFVEIGGKTGFVNNKFLREIKVLERNLQVVPYEADKQESVKPDKVQQPHEVIEGTTIYTTESAVNVAQQDISTESPSNEELTPSLNSAEENANEDEDGEDQDEENLEDENVSDTNKNLDNQNDESNSNSLNTAPTNEARTTTFNENVELSSETTPESTEQTADNNSGQNEPEKEQDSAEVPKDVPSEALALPQLLATNSNSMLNSDSVIEVPEKQDFLQNALKESEQKDSKDQNTSSVNNKAENTSQETLAETNVPNGNSLNDVVENLNGEIVDNSENEISENPTNEPEVPLVVEPVVPSVNEPEVPPIAEPVVPSVNEPVVPPVNEPVAPVNEPVAPVNEPVAPVNEPVAPINEPVTPVNEPVEPVNEPIVPPVNEPTVPPTKEPIVPPVNEPIVPPVNEPILLPVHEPVVPSVVNQINQVILPIYPNINAGNQHSEVPQASVIESNEDTTPPEEQMIPASMDASPTIKPVPAPSTETILPIFTDTNIPTTTETIPPLFSQEQQTVPPADTIPPLMNMEAPPTTQFPTQDFPPIFTQTTTPTPNIPEESSNNIETPGSASQEDSSSSPYASVEDVIAALPDSTEETSAPTEAPVQDENTAGFFSNMYSSVADIWPSTTQAPEPLYNTEYPTYESEKADGNEGFSFVKYFMSTYYSIMGTSEETKALFASVGQTCFSDEYCDGTSNDGSNRLLTFLLTTASSVLLFTLGYYYIDNRRQDGRLIGTINSLQRDLLFTTKECEILKEELTSTKNKLAGIEDSSFGMDDMVQSLKEEINELKATNERLRNSLDDNEKLLRVSENTAGELQNTLSEVENTLSELLAERANSEEQIVELNAKIQAFEEELISVSRERDNFQLKYVSAESALDEFKKQKKQHEVVSQNLAETKNKMELQEHEIKALKDAIKDLSNGMPANVDATTFIDHTEIKAKLAKALEEKNSFETRFEVEHQERTRLAEELKTTKESLASTSQNATEALTRLEVLGKYFQEREGELLKELSAKESLYLSKQGESASTVEKIELLQQEVQRYKEKCDALTLELAEQESSRRSALSEVETRAHTAWLEARQAKRELDAARDEAAALRRKLAALGTADGAVSPHHKISSPLEPGEAVLPPPLPPMFLPPPLLPPLPRPPPLGRLPSPHPPRYGDRRYSPDSRYSPESRYSPDSRYSPETVRYSPDSRYSPRSRRSPYSPRSRRRSRSRERYEDRAPRSRNGPAPPLDTETEYNSDSPTRLPRRRGRYSRHSGPSSGSGCSSESDK
ncbi:transport and Golgi organization protein 1-like isoform X1 [Spodoptera litura]|uniref:Transport and Golgi organization protein 1-like isoform X1 n=1 Tax=Spodoptera litura TaxID=69820 RepID=A0A9J7DMD0_SPOLT|nr:transport and Golgi organization protein 1-like isoform X1 [Spodoptera litura]